MATLTNSTTAGSGPWPPGVPGLPGTAGSLVHLIRIGVVHPWCGNSHEDRREPGTCSDERFHRPLGDRFVVRQGQLGRVPCTRVMGHPQPVNGRKAMHVVSILKVKGHAVETVRIDASLMVVAERLSSKRIGAVVVTDRAGHIAGIVSERDIVHALAKEGAACLDWAASEIMTRDVQTCTEGDTIDKISADSLRIVGAVTAYYLSEFAFK